MTWNLAYDHLCEFVLAKHPERLSTPNSRRRTLKADISAVSKRDDFAELKEHQVTQVCKSASIISDSLHKVLKDKLDRRNVAAHPFGGMTSQFSMAEAFIRDLIDNVVLKLV